MGLSRFLSRTTRGCGKASESKRWSRGSNHFWALPKTVPGTIRAGYAVVEDDGGGCVSFDLAYGEEVDAGDLRVALGFVSETSATGVVQPFLNSTGLRYRRRRRGKRRRGQPRSDRLERKYAWKLNPRQCSLPDVSREPGVSPSGRRGRSHPDHRRRRGLVGLHRLQRTAVMVAAVVPHPRSSGVDRPRRVCSTKSSSSLPSAWAKITSALISTPTN